MWKFVCNSPPSRPLFNVFIAPAQIMMRNFLKVLLWHLPSVDVGYSGSCPIIIERTDFVLYGFHGKVHRGCPGVLMGSVLILV